MLAKWTTIKSPINNMSFSVEEREAIFSLATNAIHMVDRYAGPDVAPAMHPSTTFRYSDDPEKLDPQRTISVNWLKSRASVILIPTVVENRRGVCPARPPYRVSTRACPDETPERRRSGLCNWSIYQTCLSRTTWAQESRNRWRLSRDSCCCRHTSSPDQCFQGGLG